EILADDDVGRQGAPRRRDFAVLLLEEDLAVLVLDLGRPLLPLDRIEGVHPLGAEVGGNVHRGILTSAGTARGMRAVAVGRRPTVRSFSVPSSHHAFLRESFGAKPLPTAEIYRQSAPITIRLNRRFGKSPGKEPSTRCRG